MNIHIQATQAETGAAAAHQAAASLRAAIAARGQANLILATGASQFDLLAQLVKEDLDWSEVSAFHLDEYIGLPESHPASFRRYLKERFTSQVPGLRSFTFVDGDAPDPQAECRRLAAALAGQTVDLACIGIGENGHLAFNDPPADFDTDEPFIVVELDEACRRQQLGEGWFPTLAAVPQRAITMTIRQIMRSRQVICTAPDARKARAVQQAVEGPVANRLPASILQQHPACDLYLDQDSAALLK